MREVGFRSSKTKRNLLEKQWTNGPAAYGSKNFEETNEIGRSCC